MAFQEGPLWAGFSGHLRWGGSGRWQGGSQPALASICIFITPPHWLAAIGSPHCPQCQRLQQGWVCQMVPCTEKRWEASLTQPQAPGLPGEEAGKPKSLHDCGCVAAPVPGVASPTWLKSPGPDLPEGIFSVSNTIPSIYLSRALFMMMECSF